MKIAILFRNFDSKGGALRQLILLARRLEKAGHRVTFYTFSYSPEKCFPELIGDIPVVTLPKERHLPNGGFFGFLNESRMARRLARLIDKDTDLLNPHDAPMHHTAYFFKKDIKNIPSVWQMNEMTAMRWPPELLPIVEDLNFHDIPRRPLWIKKIKIILRTWYDNFFVRAQDVVVVFDTYHKNLLKKYSGMDAVVVPSGTDVVHIPQYEKSTPKKGEKLLILSSGIFASYRRYEDILYALPKLIQKGYDPYLTILSDYTTDKKYYNILLALVKKFDLEGRVKFHGTYTDKELNDFFAKSHIFIFPHLQSQGLSVNEAVAAGLPTIVTPFPGTYETLKDRHDVLYAAPRDPNDLMRAIDELLGNPYLYQKLSREGSRTIRERYTWDRYAEEMIKIFVQVAQR